MDILTIQTLFNVGSGFALAVGTLLGAYGMYVKGRRDIAKDATTEQKDLFTSMLVTLKADYAEVKTKLALVESDAQKWRETSAQQAVKLIEYEGKFKQMQNEIDTFKSQIAAGFPIDKNIADSIKNGIVSINQLGVIEAWNCEASRLLGWVPSEIIGRSIKIIMPHTVASKHDSYISDYLQRDRVNDVSPNVCKLVEAKHKNGTMVPIVITFCDVHIQETDVQIITAIFHERQIDSNAR